MSKVCQKNLLEKFQKLENASLRSTAKYHLKYIYYVNCLFMASVLTVCPVPETFGDFFWNVVKSEIRSQFDRKSKHVQIKLTKFRNIRNLESKFEVKSILSHKKFRAQEVVPPFYIVGYYKKRVTASWIPRQIVYYKNGLSLFFKGNTFIQEYWCENQPRIPHIQSKIELTHINAKKAPYICWYHG